VGFLTVVPNIQFSRHWLPEKRVSRQQAVLKAGE